MEKVSTWVRASPSCISRLPTATTTFNSLKLSSNLHVDHNSTSTSKRRKSPNLPGAVKARPATVQTSGAAVPSGSSQLQNTVAALEQAYKQVSSSSSSELDGACIKSGKRSIRLSLRNRNRSRKTSTNCGKAVGSSEGDDEYIWTEEADNLVRSLFDTKPVDWHNLNHGLLTSEEDNKLVELIKAVTHLQHVRAELKRVLRREPSDDEWATAANIDFKTLRRKLQLGQAAQNKLIQHNCRLVLYLARKHQRDAGSFTLEDLCQEGLKGLLDAMVHFDPNKGARFSTYAIFWIRTAILRAITRTGQIMRLPLRFTEKKLEIRRARRELLLELDRQPTDEEVMERVGMDVNQYRTIQNTNFRVRSLNETIRGTDEELADYLPERGEIVADLSEVRAEVEMLLGELKPKEKMVLKHRYGLEDGLPVIHSLREVGKRLKMSQEMVRRYEATAFKRLRHGEEQLSYIRQCIPPYF